MLLWWLKKNMEKRPKIDKIKDQSQNSAKRKTGSAREKETRMASKVESRNKSVDIDVKTVDDKPKTTASMKSPTGDRAKSSPKKDSSDVR